MKRSHLLDLLVSLLFLSLIETIPTLLVILCLSILYTTICLKRFNPVSFLKPVMVFILLLLLPVAFNLLFHGNPGDWHFAVIISLKVIISSVLLGTLIDKEGVQGLLEECMQLGLPSYLNRILALTYRYFFMIASDVSRGRQALLSRGLAQRKGLSSISVFGELIGGFFIQSSEHGEQVFKAMSLRGFEGEPKGRAFFSLRVLVRLLLLITLYTLIFYTLKRSLYGH